MQWQATLVGIIVVAAVLFAAWRLPGAATRMRFVSLLKRLSGERGLLAGLARRLESGERRDGSACSGCSAAGSHPPAPRKP